MSTAHPIRKRFGQHFLHDPNVIGRLIREIHLLESDEVIEIGPGLGALTLPLLNHVAPKNYLALEIDRDAIASLQSLTAGINAFEILEADALRTDFNELLPDAPTIRFIGNLPYNISTPLIFHLLKFKHRIHDMTFMLQKEVVNRMVANPDNKIYGRLSVMVQAHCDAEKLFEVSPAAFNPPPKVDSAIVRLIPNTAGQRILDSELFTNLVREAFNQRRKTIRNSMGNFLNNDDFGYLKLDMKKRAENISVDEFISIANYLVEKNNTAPEDTEI